MSLPEEQKVAKKPSEKSKKVEEVELDTQTGPAFLAPEEAKLEEPKMIEIETRPGLTVVAPGEKAHTIEDTEIKEDWQKTAENKRLQAHFLIEELQSKYKNKKADHQDPLYKQWLLVRGQVEQAEVILATQKKLAESTKKLAGSTRYLEMVIKKMKQSATLEKDFLSLVEEEERLKVEEEKLKLETEILPLQIATLTEAFDSTELEIAILTPPPPIAENLQRLSLKEEAEEEEAAAEEVARQADTKAAEEKTESEFLKSIKKALAEKTMEEKDLELLRRFQDMAKKEREAAYRLEKAQADRRNLFRRWFRGLVRGKELPEEKEFIKADQEHKAADLDYDEAWDAYDVYHNIYKKAKKAEEAATRPKRRQHVEAYITRPTKGFPH